MAPNAASEAETSAAMDALIAKGERRRDAGEPPSKRGDSLAYAPPPGDGDYNNPRNWLTGHELSRLHELQQALPSAASEREAAQARIREKLARRKAPIPDGALFSVSQSTRQAFDARIDALFAGGKANLHGVRVLDRSDVLDMLGMGDGPVLLAEGKVKAGIDNVKIGAVSGALPFG